MVFANGDQFHISMGSRWVYSWQVLSSTGQLPNTEKSRAHDLYDPISEAMKVNKMIPCLKGSKTEPSSSVETLKNPEEERVRL